MRIVTFTSCLSALLLLLSLAPAAHALDDNGAKAVIDQFLKSQKIEEGQASAGQHVIADVNGDGRPDIVLQWTILGPTWWLPKLSVFIEQGRNYRTINTDLTGQIEKVSARGSSIFIDTMTLGPKDARCCPTLKKRLTYQWTGQKLVMLK
jgi:hypothetical protein